MACFNDKPDKPLALPHSTFPISIFVYKLPLNLSCTFLRHLLLQFTDTFCHKKKNLCRWTYRRLHSIRVPIDIYKFLQQAEVVLCEQTKVLARSWSITKFFKIILNFLWRFLYKNSCPRLTKTVMRENIF